MTASVKPRHRHRWARVKPKSGWICTLQMPGDWIWCEKPAAIGCESLRDGSMGCFEGRCRKHGRANIEKLRRRK